MGPVTVLSSDAHVFEPPDLWTKRIDVAFRDRAPRMVRVDGADEIVVEQGQVLSGIGLLSNTGVRFEAPETISGRARFEDVVVLKKSADSNRLKSIGSFHRRRGMGASA